MGTFSAYANVRGEIFVELCWGVKDLDRSEVGEWDSNDTGKLIWDDTFTVTPVEN